jgi:hypothetical protein
MGSKFLWYQSTLLRLHKIFFLVRHKVNKKPQAFAKLKFGKNPFLLEKVHCL